MPAKFIDYNATVTHINRLTSSLAIFRIVPDEPVEEPFLPGQYAVLGLNHEEKGCVLRAYSICSPPYAQKEYFEYYVRYVKQPTSENPLTHLLFNLKEGDRIHQRAKLKGKFTIKDTMGEGDSRLKIFVAAGTGLAPFYSMIMQHYHETGETENFAVVHGASYPEDLGYREELEQLMNRDGRKRYVATISRPKEAQQWPGMTGRTESHFEPDRIGFLEREMGLEPGFINPKNCTVMICGLQGTIANTAAHLFHRGFVPEDRKLRIALGIPQEVHANLFWEQYDTTPVLDVKDEPLMREMADRLRSAGIALAAV